MIPAYAKVYNVIKNEILNDTYIAGDFLPPEPELCKRFGVSRVTIRHAINLLTQDGYIVVKQGHGTIVQDHHSVTHKLNVVTSISETLKKQGYHVDTRNMMIEFISPNKKLIDELHLKEGSRAVRIQRIQLADEIPVAIMKNYLVPDMVPGIENYINKFVSLYRFLEDHYNINIDSAKDLITAKGASTHEARLLGVPEQTALINFRRICYSQSIPVIVDQVYILGDFYQYEFDVTGRAKREDPLI